MDGPGVRSGRRVSQGDVIGYVGSTGLSTGPHLDYRVQRDGKFMDPLSLVSEPAPPLAELELERYGSELERLRRLLRSADALAEGELRGEPAVIAG